MASSVARAVFLTTPNRSATVRAVAAGLGPGATDKAEAIANDLAMLLDDWRHKTNDVIPSDFAGTRIAERYTETYLQVHGPRVTSRSAIASERGIDDDHSPAR